MDTNPGSQIPDGRALIVWGVAERSFPGEATSGDLFLVKPVPDGALVAVVDGLGHGDEAAVAARRAVDTLERNSEQSITALVAQCHRDLRTTRGVVMSLAAFKATGPTLTWLGVGNVEGVLHRAGGPAQGPPARLIPRRGVVGYQLPELRAEELALAAGDTLILATDGIRSEFADGLLPAGSPQQTAEHVLKQFGKNSDDALVVVVRYLGVGHDDRVGRADSKI